ncbi:MAG: M28 family peptidase [bacterium]
MMSRARKRMLRLATLAAAMAATVLGTSAGVEAQRPDRPMMQGRMQAAVGLLDADTFEADLRFLSHDLLEGRAPASRGEALAAEYIEARLRMAGAEGFFEGGSYRQAVPLIMQRADPDMTLTIAGRGERAAYDYGPEFVVDSGIFQPTVEVDGEMVFVGYGIQAPEYDWDDYAGMDVAGKVLVMLVNDPPATQAEPDLFEGRAMTYYGRWTYKYEIAQDLGAEGVILVHETEMAGYGWNVVESSWSGDQFSLAGEGGDDPLKMRGWVTNEVARQIMSMAGQDLDELMQAAARRDFQPVDLGLSASTAIRNTTERMTGTNVAGVVRGSGEMADEYVMYSAHLDHLGMREGVGDVIYNGAFDNASGTAAVLNLAEVLGTAPERMRSGRSFVFALVTAEESGLLGSKHLAENLPVSSEKVQGVINLDGINLWGETDDLVLGAKGRTGMGKIVEEVAASMDMEVKDYPNPEVGSYFRSDHFSFSKQGVPAHSLKAGEDYRGRPEGWGEEFFQRWTRDVYHQPGDEFSEDFLYEGALQVMKAALLTGWEMASMEGRVRWKEGDPFGRIRSEPPLR